MLYALKSEMTLDESNYEVDIVPAKGYEIEKDSKVVQLNADKLRFPLEIRAYETGDKIRSLGIDFLECVNGENWMPSLMNFFSNRRQRSG